MKIRPFYTSLTLLLLSTLLLTNTFAQDYTQLNLPKGAKARLGKGVISNIQLSPDNTRLAITSSIGIWLYDVSTRAKTTPLVRYDKHTVSQMVFSPDSKTLAMSTHDKTLQLWNANTGENLLTFSTSGGPFISLKFSADGKTLVSQNWNGTVWFWDLTTGKQLNTLRPKRPKIRLGKDRILHLAADAFVDRTSSVTFAVGNKDGTISIQDGPTGREIRKLIVQADDSSALPIQSPRPYTYGNQIIDGQPALKWVSGLNFSPDGKTLVNGISHQIARWDGSSRARTGPTELWDVETGEQLAVLPYGIGVAFLGDGKTLAIIEYGECTIWNVATRRKIAGSPKGRHVAFSGDGKTFAIIENEGYTLWDIATRSEIAVHTPIIEWFDFFPERFLLSQDGTILVTADGNGTVALWETKNTNQLLFVTTGYAKPFTALVFSHDGKTIASGGDSTSTILSGDSTSTIHLWDTHTGTKQNTMKAGSWKVEGLAFATDNVTLTAVNSQENIIQWDITTSEQVAAHTLPNTNISIGGWFDDDGTSYQRKGLAFTPNSEKLAVKNTEKRPIKSLDKTTIDIWDIMTDRSLHHLTEFVVHWGPIALTPDGGILASGSDSQAATDLWSTHTGNRIATLKTPGNWANDLLVWLRLRYSSIHALAFTHDRETLAVGTQDKHIQLWNVTDHQHIGSLEGHKHVVCELAFSPDRKTLASGDSGGKIHLWELPTHRHLTTFDSHKGYVRTLAFAPDGKTLASISGHDGTIFLWNVPSK